MLFYFIDCKIIGKKAKIRKKTTELENGNNPNSIMSTGEVCLTKNKDNNFIKCKKGNCKYVTAGHGKDPTELN